MDIVVEFEKPIGLKFIELSDYIEKVLGKKVDILTPAGINGIRVKKVVERASFMSKSGISMDTDEKNDLKKIVNATLKEISGIEAVYLFGSIAKGKENERSDYDIAVIVREYPEKDMDKIARIRYSLLGKIKRPLEILLLGMDDLEYSSPFLYEIYHASRLLYGTDILIRCKNVVEKIRPIIAEGNKVGYYV